MKICAKCGGVRDDTERFCTACGTPTVASAAANSPVRILVVVGLAALAVLVVLSQLSDIPQSAGNVSRNVAGHPVPQNAVNSGVTQRDFLSVRTGMSVDQVAAILGSGDEISRSDIAGYNTVMYSWKNRNGSNMNVMFQNGSVVSKAQFGLR
jgi:hypothetical protein